MLTFVAVITAAATLAQQPAQALPDFVRVAAVQICGYDKTDVPRPGYVPAAAMVRHINKAGADGAQLVVFPEYVLGRIPVPSPATETISNAAAANRILLARDGHIDPEFAV